MGISETIIASIIGALATMLTAIFQLVRNRAPSDGRPKPKKSRMRSMLATVALMIGCIVGGYAWSSLRAVSAKDDLKATMEAEFAEQFAALAARQNPESAGRLREWRSGRLWRRDPGAQWRGRLSRIARSSAALQGRRASR